MVCLDLGHNHITCFGRVGANVAGDAMDDKFRYPGVDFDFGGGEFERCEGLADFDGVSHGCFGVEVGGCFEDDGTLVGDFGDHEPELSSQFFVDSQEDLVDFIVSGKVGVRNEL